MTAALYEIEASEDGTTHLAEHLWIPGEDALENGFITHHGLYVTGIDSPADDHLYPIAFVATLSRHNLTPSDTGRCATNTARASTAWCSSAPIGSAGPGQAAGAVRTASAASRRFLIIGFGSPLRLTRTTWLGERPRSGR